MSAADKVTKDPPYKLLALDGGGIRGVITLEILREIERTLQTELKRDDRFVLADYFDYIAGTSTGAIIASFLSLGWRVSRILEFYVEAGPAMFDRASLLKRFRYKFEDDQLADLLKQQIGADITLGDPKLRTLLLLVMRNATTDSPWPVSNNPRAKFNDPARLDDNTRLPLWQLVRASTAAPTYFPPETIEIGRQRFVFVDGGVTMYNNPAFQLFLMSTVSPYRLCWEAGEEKMLLVSIGTGTSPVANADLMPGEMNLVYNATSIPSALMFAAANEQDFLCRVFGNTLCGDGFDREVGDLIGPATPLPSGRVPGPVHPKLFTYMRYNAELTHTGLASLRVPHIVPEHVQQLDSVDHIAALQEVGVAVGRQKVRREHFAAFLR
ncbi:MAG: patatin-like phospholipase family protein [Acidobacteria bacterium]|nr:patatin-like phospholipase family protein [Acidobacteriota bacterium]